MTTTRTIHVPRVDDQTWRQLIEIALTGQDDQVSRPVVTAIANRLALFLGKNRPVTTATMRAILLAVPDELRAAGLDHGLDNTDDFLPLLEVWLEAYPPVLYTLLWGGCILGTQHWLVIDGAAILLRHKRADAAITTTDGAAALARTIIRSRCGDTAAQRAVFVREWNGAL